MHLFTSRKTMKTDYFYMDKNLKLSDLKFESETKKFRS